MNEQLLEEMIEHWEPEDAEVVRVIDSEEGTVERIVKHGSAYYLYRYFQLESVGQHKVFCSIDLSCVDADRVIQHLAERL